MSVEVLTMFEKLAEHGTAPEEGCSLYGVGLEAAFQTLESKYLLDRFSRGVSAEKFVIGPYGSGKTHFLRQLMEIGRSRDCVTIEVKLNKDLDYTQGLAVFQEMARRIRPPGRDTHGIGELVEESVSRVRAKAEEAGFPSDELLLAWINGIAAQDFPLPAFARVLRRALLAYVESDTELFEAGMRWIGGEVRDASLPKRLGESPLSASELRIHAHNARLSLYRFVRYAGFRGTIVGFDEAEQGIEVEKKRMTKIFSHLLAEINSIIDLKDGSVLVLYAITPSLLEKMNIEMPMLKQRLDDPGPKQAFFDGNVLAPKIDLTKWEHSAEELTRIGEKLVRVFFEKVADADVARRDEALAAVPSLAAEVERTEQSSSARREIVKRVCAPLVNLYRTTSGPQDFGHPSRRDPEV